MPTPKWQGLRWRRWGRYLLAAALAALTWGALGPGARAGSPTPTAATSPAAVVEGGVSWVTTSQQVVVDGVTQSYLVTMPADPGSGRLPVLMVLHGFGVTPAFEEQRTDFWSVTGPAILVYPAGYRGSWDAGTCCGAAWGAGINDVAGLTAVLHQVLTTIPQASHHRVYLAGYSNGGKMALLLADQEPGLFAGVAVYGAVAAFPAWSRPPPASVLELASTGDPELTIGPGGPPKVQDGFTEPTVLAETEAYVQADQCGSQVSVSQQGSLSVTTWKGCADHRQVALGLYQGGSHNWPRGTAGTPSGAAVMWRFFQSLPVSPAAASAAKPAPRTASAAPKVQTAHRAQPAHQGRGPFRPAARRTVSPKRGVPAKAVTRPPATAAAPSAKPFTLPAPLRVASTTSPKAPKAAPLPPGGAGATVWPWLGGIGAAVATTLGIVRRRR